MPAINTNPDGTFTVDGPLIWDTKTMGPNPSSISVPTNQNAPTYGAWLFSNGTTASPEKYQNYLSQFGSGQGPSTPDPGSVLYQQILSTMGYSGLKPPTTEEATQYVNKQYSLSQNPTPTETQNITPNTTQGSTGQQSPLSPSPFPTQQQSNGTPSVSSTNPYMSLPSYGTSIGMYPQSFANSGTQNQADPSGGTGNYSPTNYNKLPTYGFYY